MPVTQIPPFGTESAEKSLLEGLKNKSPQAFDELVGRHARRLFSVAMRILQNAQDAEDCVQETFLKAFRSVSSFRGQASLATWLHRIATNQALMKLRRERGNPVVAVESYLPQFKDGKHATEIPSWRDGPDLVLQRQELREVMEKLVAELPEHYRTPYVLKDVEQLSESEVSKLLGMPKTTLKNRVHRARLVIRRRLEDRLLGPNQAARAATTILQRSPVAPEIRQSRFTRSLSL